MMDNAVNGVRIIFGFSVPRHEWRGYGDLCFFSSSINSDTSLVQSFKVGIKKFHKTLRTLTYLSSLIDNAMNGVRDFYRDCVPRRERRGYGVGCFSESSTNGDVSLAQPFRVGIGKFHQNRRAFTPLHRTIQITDFS